MISRIPVWIKIKEKTGNNALFRKIVHSLDRDRNISFSLLFPKARTYVTSMYTRRIILRKCSKVGKHPKTHRRPRIENRGAITIGDDVYINSRNVQTDLLIGAEGILEIGDEVNIDFGVFVVANKRIIIGNRVRIGPYTMIYDSNQHVHDNLFKRASDTPLVIEDDVCLASRVVVLRGSRIGKGSLITAGSVVSGIIPPYVIAGGIPARIIEYLEPPKNSGFCWEHTGKISSVKANTSFRVREIASEVFSTDIDSITGKLSYSTLPNWNSFQHVKFIHRLEKEFNIQFDTKDWTQMSSIDKIVCVVQKYLDKQSANIR